MAYVNGSKQSGGRAYRQHQTLKEYIRERGNYTCQLCGKPNSHIVDHIIPWRVSHDSTITNLRVLCFKCNVKTRRKRVYSNLYSTLEEWYRYLEAEATKC